ncbi:kinase-like protein [Trichocladium antarcticum]|uniref:Kinase-like protein n=1 Tax=Trichocladium antarcticum TaxID=1450529 RepID=A0AAN6UBY0_9PEZI|nr:kinase-like protein [Trichocladium antarcticum]
MSAPLYHCGIDAEPLHRYQPGGYHPLGLGDFLKAGRYQVLHKLGWGGYSTTWAAKDHKKDRYVAVKIIVSETKHKRELEVLRAMSALPRHHPGWSHVNQMLDSFTLAGPNGTHDCLVLELLGPSVADIVELYCKDDRLSASLAKSFASQAMQGLDFLACHNIGHGDIHTRNLAITVPGLESLDEKGFFERFGSPYASPVTRLDGECLMSNVPSHIVQPASSRMKDILLSSPTIKVIDFGEAFFKDSVPDTLHTPLSVRAPEVIFGDPFDCRVDMWSAGCLLFELVTGQPPFDVTMITPPLLVQQMMEFATDGLPPRWQGKWQAMQEGLSHSDEEDTYTLQGWLEEVYFDDCKHSDFTRDDIAKVGKLIERLLKFEPSLRATASDVLADAWFEQG